MHLTHYVVWCMFLSSSKNVRSNDTHNVARVVCCIIFCCCFFFLEGSSTVKLIVCIEKKNNDEYIFQTKQRKKATTTEKYVTGCLDGVESYTENCP